MHTGVHTYVCVMTHWLIRTYIHTYIRTYIHACMHAYMHTCIHAYMHMPACMNTCIHSYMHTCIHAHTNTEDAYLIQGGEDPSDALSCRSFPAKEPLIVGLSCWKWPVKIRHSMPLCHPVKEDTYMIYTFYVLAYFIHSYMIRADVFTSIPQIQIPYRNTPWIVRQSWGHFWQRALPRYGSFARDTSQFREPAKYRYSTKRWTPIFLCAVTQYYFANTCTHVHLLVTSVTCHYSNRYNTLHTRQVSFWKAQHRLCLTATHCHTLQLTATHCNTLQHTATGIILKGAASTVPLPWLSILLSMFLCLTLEFSHSFPPSA